MRLSRSRVFLRAVLLVVGGAFMLWKAVDAFRSASGSAGDEGVLLEWIAAVEALVGVLALVAAGVALRSLRPRQRKHTLVLRDVART
ncbi:MAG TPA: hypothetical protein VD838_16560, partial [Anaeromyxobacteraceae bacterium]|nr:hypothetical protein [Anaeromyxobacteraceae bacterium]